MYKNIAYIYQTNMLISRTYMNVLDRRMGIYSDASVITIKLSSILHVNTYCTTTDHTVLVY